MTDQFKVGDRVKYIGAPLRMDQDAPKPDDLHPGQCGTVCEIREASRYTVRILVDGLPDNWWWTAPDELEPTDVPAPTPPTPPLTIEDVSKYIQTRVTELQVHVEQHPEGTEHYCATIAGQFELLRLAVSLGLPNVVDETTVVNPVPEA